MRITSKLAALPSSGVGGADRIAATSGLVVVIFLSVLLLGSQSGASFATYLLGLTMLFYAREWRDVFSCKLAWATAALLSYLSLTSFWSVGFTWSEFFSQMVRAILVFSFVVAVAESQVRGVLKALLYDVLVVVAAVVALLCIANYYLNPPVGGRLIGFGQLDTAVIAGLVFSFAFLVALHQLLSGSRVHQVALMVVLVILGAAVALTGSRGAVLAMVTGSGCLAAAHVSQTYRGFFLILALFALVAGALGWVVWMDSELQAIVFPRGDSFRLVIWRETLERIMASPWAGIGILSPDDVSAGNFVFAHPHNLFLAVTLQGGVIAACLFLVVVMLTLRELVFSIQKPDAKLALGILGLALPAYCLDGHELLDKVSDTWFLIWLPVALAIGLRWRRSY